MPGLSGPRCGAIAIGKGAACTHAGIMFATVIAMAAMMTPEAGASRVATALRVEAIVVRPPVMPTIIRRGASVRIDNPGAIAISIDDEAPRAATSRTIRAADGVAVRRITLIF